MHFSKYAGKNTLRNFLFVLSGGAFFVPSFAFAALVYIDPPQKDVHYGDTFTMNVRVDNENECINVVDIVIHYDNRAIEAVDFGRGESLITLWVDPPKIDKNLGTITLSGGMPGGYCGHIVGDPGLSNLLGKIVFSTTGNQIVFSSGTTTQVSIGAKSKILLNDGLGTPATLRTEGASVTVTEQGSSVTNEWVDEISKDTIPPEPFEVLVHHDPNVADGKYFIVFTTTDKQSGIDHFEVFESSLDNPGYEEGTNKPAQWRKVDTNEQYYVLIDQTLKSKVIVKAVDKANNEQLAELNIGETSVSASSRLMEKIFLGAIALGMLVIFIGTIMFVRHQKSHATKGGYHDGI